jgi:DNA-directed RNA polymerase specialized sigma24 family protein
VPRCNKRARFCIRHSKAKWKQDAVCGQRSAWEEKVDLLSEAQAARELIRRCLSGEAGAAREFQERYGELIYGFPMRVYRVPPEDAGDFYVFAFDRGRIFRRVRTFEGRAPFRAYLLGFVLDDLVLEWKRGVRELETVSMETLGEFAAPEDPRRALGGDPNEDAVDRSALSVALAELEPSKAVVMKLLYVEDYELSPGELRYLAEVAGCDIAEVLTRVDRLRATVREREASLKRMEDSLDAVQAWIQLYERRRQRLVEDLSGLPPESATARRFREEEAELQRKIDRRRRQRSKLLDQTQRRKVTAPYKDIAALLNTSVGNVGSQIARLRRELLGKIGARSRAEEGALPEDPDSTAAEIAARVAERRSSR